MTIEPPKLFEIEYGKDGKGQWFWRDKQKLEGWKGPFKTLKAAERDSVKTTTQCAGVKIKHGGQMGRC